jgi:hypothetical protein
MDDTDERMRSPGVSPTVSPITTPDPSPVKKKQKVSKAVWAMTMFTAKCHALVVQKFLAQETSKLLIDGKRKWSEDDPASHISTHMILSHFNRIDLRGLIRDEAKYVEFLFQSVTTSKGRLAINETAFAGKFSIK